MWNFWPPPPLAAFLIVVTGCNTSDGFYDILRGFLPFVLAAYSFGILPSILYVCAMEFWFQKGLHARCGLLCTVGLSSLLGIGAGFLIQLVIIQGLEITYFLSIGALVGAMIGFYVGRHQPASPSH
jgi:hypothetical protein